MKIENNSINSLSTNKTNNVVSSEEKSKSISKKQIGHTQDKVHISDQAQLLSKAMQTYKNIDDVRIEKIRDLQEQLDAGVYEISPEVLAKHIMSQLEL